MMFWSDMLFDYEGFPFFDPMSLFAWSPFFAVAREMECVRHRHRAAGVRPHLDWMALFDPAADLLYSLPSDVIAMEWGYEDNHPFLDRYVGEIGPPPHLRLPCPLLPP
jgi:hypothetical protein